MASIAFNANEAWAILGALGVVAPKLREYFRSIELYTLQHQWSLLPSCCTYPVISSENTPTRFEKIKSI